MLRGGDAILFVHDAISRRIAQRHGPYEKRTGKNRRAWRRNVEETATHTHHETNQKPNQKFHRCCLPFDSIRNMAKAHPPAAVPQTQRGKATEWRSIRAPINAPPPMARMAAERLCHRGLVPPAGAE